MFQRKSSAFGSLFGLISIGVIVALSLTACSNPNTPAGHEGYVYEKPRIFGTGGYRATLKGPQNYGVSLWRNQIINIDMRSNTYTESFKILANDDLNISFNFHCVISIRPDTVKFVVENYGGDKWYQRIVRETFRTYVRSSVQKYNSRDLKANREKISEEVTSKLQNYLKDTPFSVTKVVVGNINYPEIVANAVEKKLAAQQLLSEKETQKEIARKDAEIRVEEAKGIAQAQKIINTTLTTNYLQHEAINAQLKMAESPNHTTVYIPVGTNGIPLIKGTK